MIPHRVRQAVSQGKDSNIYLKLFMNENDWIRGTATGRHAGWIKVESLEVLPPRYATQAVTMEVRFTVLFRELGGMANALQRKFKDAEPLTGATFELAGKGASFIVIVFTPPISVTGLRFIKQSVEIGLDGDRIEVIDRAS